MLFSLNVSQPILILEFPKFSITNTPNVWSTISQTFWSHARGQFLLCIFNFDRTFSKVSADLPSSLNCQNFHLPSDLVRRFIEIRNVPTPISPRQILFALSLPNENLFAKNNPWKYFKGHCADFQLATKFSDGGARRAGTPKLQKSFDVCFALNVGLCNAVA